MLIWTPFSERQQGPAAERTEAMISTGVTIRLPPQAELLTRQAGSHSCRWYPGRLFNFYFYLSRCLRIDGVGLAISTARDHPDWIIPEPLSNITSLQKIPCEAQQLTAGFAAGTTEVISIQA